MKTPFDLARLSPLCRQRLQTHVAREAADLRHDLQFWPDKPSETKDEMHAWLEAVEDLQKALSDQ